jgi:hypothetical protein
MLASASRLRSAECRCRGEWACARPICFLSTGALSTPPSKGGALPPEVPVRRLEGQVTGVPAGRLDRPAMPTRGWRRPTATGSGITTAPRAADAPPPQRSPSRTNTTRSSLHRRPTPARHRPPSPSTSNHPPSSSPRRFTHRSPPHRSPRPSTASLRLPPPRPPGPPASAWADPPGFTWMVEEGGPAQRGGPPSSKASGAERNEQVWAGRRPVRP